MGKTISKTTADLGLLSVTVFWGTTFILSKIVLEEISLSKYLAIRLVIAAVAMSLYALRFRHAFNRQVLKHGFILGIFLFFSYFFQMWGITFTTASKAGFITGLNVVFVPIFSVLFFGDHPRKASIIGVIFATIGLFFLSGGDISELNSGDWLVFVCALVVSFHVILTGRFAPKNNIYVLTAVQLSTIALFSLIFVGIDPDPGPPVSMHVFGLLVYLALFGTLFTFLMQTAMQRFTTATRTALVFTMEPVFAALFAYLIGGEMMTMPGWVGGGLILCGMIIAELDWGKMTAAFRKQKAGGSRGGS
jgi:drug/metabolite transporter (DMT)-like permease